MSTKDDGVVRSMFFNFHSGKSIIIAKLKTKSGQNLEMCQYEIGTNNDGNLMPIEMFKALFPYTKITDLSASVDRNNITCLQQLLYTTVGSVQGHHN